jgi:HPt (histidine-containing phosphotransfer) domain-containing protein
MMASITTSGFPEGGGVDWRVALQTVSGDRQLLLSVVECFLEETPQLMLGLRQALAQSDAAGVVQRAHTLKSSMHYFGIRKGFDLAIQIERLGRSADLAAAGQALAALECEIAQAVSVMTEYERSAR